MSTFGRVQFHRTRKADLPLVAIKRNVVVVKEGQPALVARGSGTNGTEERKANGNAHEMDDDDDDDDEDEDGDYQGFQILRGIFQMLRRRRFIK